MQGPALTLPVIQRDECQVRLELGSPMQHIELNAIVEISGGR